jgi:hypothetical protein
MAPRRSQPAAGARSAGDALGAMQAEADMGRVRGRVVVMDVAADVMLDLG